MRGDGLRLALGTLTVLRVHPRGLVDRAVGGAAMVWAPAVAALLAAPVAGTAWVLGLVTAAPWPTAAVTLSVLALLTRGIHLDGLADVADGLGAGRRGGSPLEVMRRGDVGPFGVVALALVLLVQAAALSSVLAGGPARAAGVLLVALVSSRAVLVAACWRGLPAARPDGLGAAVAATQPGRRVVLVLLAVWLLAAVVVPSWPAGLLPLAWLPSVELLRRSRARLGGVTGDVLGGCVEVTLATSLLLLSLA